jgi:hypothetical protein
MEPRGPVVRLVFWLGGPLQLLATILTAVGTFLVAQTDANLRFIGFGVWFCSNLLWMAWAARTKNAGGILVTYCLNFSLNLLGIYNNWPW